MTDAVILTPVEAVVILRDRDRPIIIPGVAAARITKITGTLGDGIETVFEIKHNLGTSLFSFTLIKNDEVSLDVYADVNRLPDNNTAIVTFGQVPAVDQYSFVIIS